MARNATPPPQSPDALVAAVRSLCRIERGWEYSPRSRTKTFTREQGGRLVSVQIWIGTDLASCTVSVIPPAGGRVQVHPASVELAVAVVSLALEWGEQS